MKQKFISILATATVLLLVMGILLTSVFAEKVAQSDSSPAYWLWAGHTIKSTHKNSILYLHQGHVRNSQDNTRVFYKKGFAPHKINAKAMYIVIRMHKLLYDRNYIHALVKLIKHWESKGNIVKGLQLDFDSATAKLLKYSHYLKFVRAILPKQYRLSITGLGDWLVNGQHKHLIAINNSADEIVFQLYQHKTAYKNLESYLSILKSNQLPFKLGLVQQGQYNQIQLKKLTRLPNYQGSIIFTIR
ncbi:hypothetical protein MNBD_GAMMA12-1087 [hydrothermal vent metagenome]|uniref:DUF3142 domain-containing protein n=1 Tax=hydrothermal vent metagenome TaxID=652676 RepID=A0A3B0YNW4_9ZZZZ